MEKVNSILLGSLKTLLCEYEQHRDELDADRNQVQAYEMRIAIQQLTALIQFMEARGGL